VVYEVTECRLVFKHRKEPVMRGASTYIEKESVGLFGGCGAFLAEHLGILAHVDAGKTTLTERPLYCAEVIDESQGLALKAVSVSGH
jgi:hypothetical protein